MLALEEPVDAIGQVAAGGGMGGGLKFKLFVVASVATVAEVAVAKRPPPLHVAPCAYSKLQNAEKA